jgi:hypothetical protein
MYFLISRGIPEVALTAMGLRREPSAPRLAEAVLNMK